MPQRAQTAGSSFIKWIFPIIACAANCILSAATSIFRCIYSVYCFIIKSVELDQKVRPTRKVVLYNLVGFSLFLVLGGFAIGYPDHGMRVAILATGASTFIGLTYIVILDFASNKEFVYVRNLGNTILTILFSLVVFTILYEKRWYEQLNKEVVEVRQDIVENPRYPAVALVQDRTATNQANLLPRPMKCFLNKFWEEAPMCSTLTHAEIITTYSCNCNDNWVPEVLSFNDFSYVSFRPAEYIVSAGANIYMTLQAFFNYNTSTSNPGYELPNPVLWFMVYDPIFTWEEAYRGGYGPLNLYDANGVTTMNIGLTYYEALNGTGYYNYDVVFSTCANIGLICDVSQNSTEKCYSSLVMQIPRFDRTIIAKTMSMSWAAVVAEVGSYFALVQFLSWIFSGQVSE